MSMPKSIKNFLVVLVFTFLYCCNSFAGDWKIKNKWKISCGIADKESLVVNGKPKKNYNKKEFKLESVIFKLDKGDIGSCPADKKSGTHGGYPYAGRQEITHRLPI